MPKIKIKCDTCGKEIEKYQSKLNKHNFCDRKCYNEFHSKNIKKYKCEVCGKEFTGLKNNANRFCSRDCYNKVHNIKNKERKCPTCGKIFIAKTNEDKYCSWECYNNNRKPPNKENHWNWQGGKSLHNDNRDSREYKEWRILVYKKDDYKCVKCGSKNNLNAHHKKSWKHHPELRYDVNNGITLCAKCHIKLHQELGYDLKD